MTKDIEFAAFAGIDWADREHAVCVLPAAGGEPQRAALPQTPPAIAAWARQLRERFGGRPIAGPRKSNSSAGLPR